MAYKKPILNPNDPYAEPEPAQPDGPAAPNPQDPNAPVTPAPTPDDPNAKTPSPGFDPYGQPQILPDRPPGTFDPGFDTGGYAKPGFMSTTFNPTAVSGYDPAKWNSPLHQTPKYVVGRILSGYNLNDPAQLQQAMADIAKAYPGTTWAGKDVVNIPGIGNVDVIRDFGGESGIAWQPESDAQPPMMAAPSSAFSSSLTPTSASFGATSGVPTTTPATTTPTTASTLAPSSSSTALDEARRAALLELLTRKPPTAADLRDTPENQAYLLQSQRAAERQRADLAERAAFEGFDNTGYFDTEVAGINQARGEGEAGFLGELAISRMQAQREDLQFAISEAQQAGQFDLAQALQREAMNLDAALRQQQMASTERMAANDLALREFLGKAGIDLDRLRLGEDARQFNYDLGFRYSDLGVRDEAQRRADLLRTD